jgi:hypothetical protein
MPVERKGRWMTARPEDLKQGLGREVGNRQFTLRSQAMKTFWSTSAVT